MPTLDARHAELDSRLREMQAELLPERAPPEPVPRPQSAPPSPRVDASAQLSRRLVAALRELLQGYDVLLATPRRASDVSISAGPFSATAALSEFERAVAGIPGVREVTLRGFEGSDRAILEVQLDG
jgi:hypothetical protein